MKNYTNSVLKTSARCFLFDGIHSVSESKEQKTPETALSGRLVFNALDRMATFIRSFKPKTLGADRFFNNYGATLTQIRVNRPVYRINRLRFRVGSDIT